MHLPPSVFLGIAFLATTACAMGYCPPLGPVFPAPRGFSKDPTFLSATKNINDALNILINGNAPAYPFFNSHNTSVSLQIYSVDEATPLFESYYTSTSASDAKVGVNRVDGNTVFRIASISKLWTVLLLLIENGDAVLSEPVMKYIPELKNASQGPDTVDHVSWGEVTIGDLASHLAGIPREYGFGDYAWQIKGPGDSGLPRFSRKELPLCGATAACNRADFFRGLLKRHPVVPTGATPIYSNTAFQILGYTLEKITNTSYEGLLMKRLIKPLNLSRSSYSAPGVKFGLIPGDVMTSYWNLSTGEASPAGGLYSSTNDLSTIGRAILNSTLLSPALTRRWLKPASHTSSLAHSVGTPWESAYSSMTALSPDHGVGFSILAAGEHTHDTVSYLSDYVATSILPALDEIAQRNADRRFNGIYALKNTSSMITISTDDKPGLQATNWIKDNIPMLGVLSELFGAESPAHLSVRLYPTGLETQSQVSFRAVVQDMGKGLPEIGPFTSSCSTWSTIDGKPFNGVGMDEFVFNVDEDGVATSLSPRAWQYVLERQSD